MTVKEVIEMLGKADPEAEVHAADIYGEGIFPITGMVYDAEHFDMTGERDR